VACAKSNFGLGPVHFFQRGSFFWRPIGLGIRGGFGGFGGAFITLSAHFARLKHAEEPEDKQ